MIVFVKKKWIGQITRFIGLIVSLLIIIVINGGCKKYLDTKINKTLVVPSTLSDLQSLLDNPNVNGFSPALPEALSDNYYSTDANWQALMAAGVSDAFDYIWSGIANGNENGFSWDLPYEYPIYFSNIVLDQLPLIQVDADQRQIYNTLKGSALFYRAYVFQQLAQIYCKPYSTSNASSPGIVLKLSSNVSEHVTRATIQETYDRITNDLKEALTLLPATANFPSRPSKVAAYAALARTYLCMSDYVNAGNYADSALQIDSKLMDYNTLIPLGSPPISTFNEEVIYNSYTVGIVIESRSFARIDSLLYRSYDSSDLRKTLFFRQNSGLANRGTYSFQGSYNGNVAPSNLFDGLATDEMYLIRAECYARAGNAVAAITDLNTLMIKRWQTGTFTSFTAIDAADALTKVLTERRKELLFRNLRWSDIRRFNLAGANLTLKRIIAGTTYTLTPNDLRSVELIPQNEINNSGIQQNPR